MYRTSAQEEQVQRYKQTRDLTTDKYREGTSDYCKACRTCCSWYLFIVHVRTISNLRQNQSPAQLGKDSHRSSSRSHNTSRRRLCLSLALRVRPQSHRIQRPGSVTMLLIMEMSTGMTTWQACSVGGSASLMFFQSFRAASVPEQLNWYRLKPPELSHPNTAGRGTQCCGPADRTHKSLQHHTGTEDLGKHQPQEGTRQQGRTEWRS